MDISERIKELIANIGITSKELSDKTGIPYDSLKNYEYGRREPTGNALVALERFFGVSGAYLYGITDEKKPVYIWQDSDAMSAVRESFPQLIEKLLKTTIESSDLEQKMVFDILVELLHVASIKDGEPSVKAASLLLLQDTFAISTRFIDFCQRSVLTSGFEENRTAKMKDACTAQFQDALSEVQCSFVD